MISGGTSDERAVSLRSGVAISEAFITAGYEVVGVDAQDGWDEILPLLKTCDLAFIALHGAGGEDGTIQKQLEDSNILYVGSDSQSSKLCFDKYQFGKLLVASGIDTPKTELVDRTEFMKSELRLNPYVLKPNDGGSSIDTFIVRDLTNNDLSAELSSFDKHQKMLIQELIIGQEMTVAIVGNEVMPVIEIVPPANQEFDYANKYNGASQELCPPKNVDIEIQKQAQGISLRVHKLTGCRDISRTDIILGEDGKLYVLEINTIPGFTEKSLLPKAAAVAGITMPNLVDMLVKRALERK